jgi:hypothetical protein
MACKTHVYACKAQKCCLLPLSSLFRTTQPLHYAPADAAYRCSLSSSCPSSYHLQLTSISPRDQPTRHQAPTIFHNDDIQLHSCAAARQRAEQGASALRCSCVRRG